MGLIDNIKNNVAKSGANKEKILYVKSDSKVRVRFLQELDSGYELVFHDSFEKGINTLCLEELGKNCPLCGDEELRTRTLYAWSVYNYDTKRVEIMLYAVNNCTPVAGIVSMYENYGTILDRDYVLSKQGKQQNTTFTVIPQDKQKFRNEKAKPFTKSALLKIVSKAFPLPDDLISEIDDEDDIDNNWEEDDDEDEKKAKNKKKKKIDKKSSKKFADEDEDDDDIEYATIDDDEVEEYFEPKKTKKKSKKKSETKGRNIEDAEDFSSDDMSTMLEEEDIDEDEFLEYFEKEDLSDFNVSKKKFKKMIVDYLEWLEDEE